jgi:hypothetical protein
MRNPATFVIAAAAALFVPAGSVSAGITREGGPSRPVHGPTFRQPVSFGRIYMPTRSALRQRGGPLNPKHLYYYDGPVLAPSPKQYIVLWGFKKAGDPDAIAALYQKYADAYGGTPYANIVTQYFELVSSRQIYIKNPADNTFIWHDDTNPVPKNPSDTDVQSEAWNLAAHFSSSNPSESAYIVVSPYHRDPQGFPGGTWCAYHGVSTLLFASISYTNMPYMPDGGADCGANDIAAPSDESAVDEGQTIVTGHEYNESVTDPYPDTGWYNPTYNEIGDECAWQDIKNDKFGKYSFTMQPLWSNVQNACVHSH